MTEKNNNAMSWSDVMALRSAYNNGYRTPETIEACRLYMAKYRKNKIAKGVRRD